MFIKILKSHAKVFSLQCRVQNGAGFEEIIEEDLHVVDKTLFIKEFMTCSAKLCTILRPRGFGKSANLSMLKTFLSLGANPSDFARFQIGQPEHQSFVEEHCGKYPIVYLNFNFCKGDTWADLLRRCREKMKYSIYDHRRNLGEHNIYDLKSRDLSVFTARFLLDFTQMLHNLYQTKVIVLIDDYDAPLNEAYKKGYYEEAAEFFESLYSQGLKDNEHVEKACLMGRVEISGKGIFTGFNNAALYSVMEEELASSFGFTEDEILKFLIKANAITNVSISDAECKRNVENLLEWYNGCTIGNIASVINPWSFMCWYGEKKFRNYWIDTSFPNTIRKLFDLCVSTG